MPSPQPVGAQKSAPPHSGVIGSQRLAQHCAYRPPSEGFRTALVGNLSRVNVSIRFAVRKSAQADLEREIPDGGDFNVREPREEATNKLLSVSFAPEHPGTLRDKTHVLIKQRRTHGDSDAGNSHTS